MTRASTASEPGVPPPTEDPPAPVHRDGEDGLPGRSWQRGRAGQQARGSTHGATGGTTGGTTRRREAERRVLVAVLAVGLLVVGAWALAWPTSFHADFPFDRAWVALDGPYNEHLVRDVGALQLALGTVAVLALRRPWLTGVVAVATLVFAVPHLAYHATHLAPFGIGDALAQVVALAVQVLVPLRLLRIGPGLAPAGTLRGGRSSGGGP